MTQQVAGFYQAAQFDAARVTAIAANGQQGYTSPLSVNGVTLDTDPFVGAQGPRWDNPTYNVNLPSNASSFAALGTANGNVCATWAAIVASTNVPDSDFDGLPDIWETAGLHRNTTVSPATFGTCSDFPNEPCVNLPKMGANPYKRDIFIQIDWMHGTGDGSGGTDGRGTHDHMPQLAALQTVASVFANNGINLHFDVGANYQGNQALCGNAACSFIVPAAYAGGGADMDESALACKSVINGAPNHCDYPGLNYPVLSFEYGFASVRDGNSLLGIPSHFAQNRKDIFHYALFAHALAGPYNAQGQPVNPFTLQPANAPLSYSGIAHRPGGGFMVTLGLWRSDIPANDQVGSAQVQAGTLMHELGHNLGLGHAGLATQPNCMTNYPSVMNYMYQTRGLTDSTGNEHIDYSYGVLLPLSENFLNSNIPMALFPGLQRYRVRYYGPLAPGQPAAQAAQVHCDGTPLAPGAPAEVRLEGPAVSTPDWSNGTVPLGQSIPPLDLNYDGTLEKVFLDQPDWLTLNLQQIGSGYNFGGLSVGSYATGPGGYAADGTQQALDAGGLASQAGAFITDGGALITDAGAFITDGGAFLTDGGALITDGGALITDAGELDEDTVLKSTVDPPPPPTATPTISSIVLNWTPPSVGKIAAYNIYRCAGAGCTPSAPAYKSIAGGSPTPSFTDNVNDFVDAGATCPAMSTCYNTVYVYAVTSTASGSTVESLFSATATSQVTHLFVIGNNAAAVYGAAIPAPAYTIYGIGTLSSGISCSYSPATPRNAGTYPVVCSGPATASNSAIDGVSYNVPYLNATPGSLTISQRPITFTAAASVKTYDGTTSSPAMPTITTGSLAYTDTVTSTETYDNRNVGTTHVLTPAVTVSDGNGGNNYKITLVNAAGGIINVLPVTVTPSSTTKVYDGTTSSTAVPMIAPALGTGDTASFIETYSTRNVGTGIPMIASGAISDGNGGNNYSITFAGANVGAITAAPASVTPNPNSKTYGMPDPAPLTTGTLVGFLPIDNVTATYTRAPGSDAGMYNISAVLSSSGPLTNYNIVYNSAIFTILPAPQTIMFAPLSNQPLGTADFSLNATATSGLPVSFTAAGACSVTGSTVHLISAGLCTITASQAGGLDYLPAASVNQAFTITDSFVISDFTTLAPVGYPAGIPTATASTLTLSNTTGQTSAAWFPVKQTVGNGFTTQFTFTITSTGGQIADGFAFVIQNSPAGTGALGTTGMGGYLGYQGLTNSLAVEFDTYQNGWDPNANHVAIQSNYAAANTADHTSAALAALNSNPGITLADGNAHTVTITYDGASSLIVILDGTQVLSTPAGFNLANLGLDPGGNAVIGFTAATGSDSENTQILSWSFSSH
jgi:hypothetical protein